jgi:hypothetical protein
LGAASGLGQATLDEQLVEALSVRSIGGGTHDDNPVTPGLSRAAHRRQAAGSHRFGP